MRKPNSMTIFIVKNDLKSETYGERLLHLKLLDSLAAFLQRKWWGLVTIALEFLLRASDSILSFYIIMTTSIC